jgi:hypothetical protein
MAPVHCAAGSDGEMNFGVTSLAAPNAASSSVATYSLVARLAACVSSSLFHCVPGVGRCLLASATIRLASTANPSPPTRPAPWRRRIVTARMNPRSTIAVRASRVANTSQTDGATSYWGLPTRRQRTEGAVQSWAVDAIGRHRIVLNH